MTIIKDISAYRDYPYECLEEASVLALRGGCVTVSEHKSFDSLTRSLECFLQITGKKLSHADLLSSSSDELLALFCGALHSPKFRTLAILRTHALVRLLESLVNKLRAKTNKPYFQAPSLTAAPNEEVETYVGKFEKLELHKEKVWYWTGWECTNVHGQVTNLPMLPIYNKYGREFTDRIYDICKPFYATRRLGRIAAVVAISRFVASGDCKFELEDLQDSYSATEFFQDLWIHHYSHCVTSGSKHSFAITSWRNQIIPFIRDQLIPGGIFAEPHELPDPEVSSKKGAETNIIEHDGIEYKNKLLIRIPLHIPDDEAFDIIKSRIIISDRIAIAWCDKKIEELTSKLERRKALEKTGQIITLGKKSSDPKGNKWLSSPNNPTAINNLAATLQKHGLGYLIKVLINTNSPTGKLAASLGLPTTDSFLPFCLKLIRIHPEITPAFLASIELYDKHGALRGVERTDLPSYLHGYKDRKGASSSEMRVTLNGESQELVSTIIAATSPLRDHLKEIGNISWRKLLLTLPKGISKPVHYKCRTNNAPHKIQQIQQELATQFPEEGEYINELAQSLLRPTTMRSTSGVITFFNTGSVYAMAEALGHTRYDPDLLERYLPASILHFFRDRWVRIFQTGIIIQAMKDSPYLLESSGFRTMSELDSFLEQNTIKFPNSFNDPQSHNSKLKPKNKTLIALNIQVAQILLSILKSKGENIRPLNARAEHWSDFAHHLLLFLKSDVDNHLEALDILNRAEALGPLQGLEDVIYEPT
ncbi:hypothetical protein [Pseudomonas citronellolis]|uniref:hypothetical protein n=1 Tax=Pseudomonas citronellolis TaxID=53408 RepID=UPI0018D8EE82|nr:hypothetical protein [Pseudomonas citronellolis]MBH3431297.1 hypothetical protein [Pseudomonas citronellolis]